jgi:hypothetical protein
MNLADDRPEQLSGDDMGFIVLADLQPFFLPAIPDDDHRSVGLVVPAMNHTPAFDLDDARRDKAPIDHRCFPLRPPPQGKFLSPRCVRCVNHTPDIFSPIAAMRRE